MTTDPTRTPYCHKIRYGITGAPILTEDEMDGSHAPGVDVRPKLIEFVYSAARDGKPASVSASVTGVWTRFGEPADGQVTAHFVGDLSGWPAWLAAEARLHDPDAVLAYPTDRAALLTEAAEEAERVAESLRAHHEFERSTGALDVMTELRRLAAEAPTTKPEASEIQVWPLKRVLADVRCGSEDWSWEEEWADLNRRHAETGYLAKLEEAIRENGITMPVLVGSDGRLWDGHHRLCLAVRLGIDYVPVEIVPPAAEVQQDGAQTQEERRG